MPDKVPRPQSSPSEEARRLQCGVCGAATKGTFRGTFKPTGAHKAIIELAGADFNIAAGCSGLGAAAANVTIVGANSRYDVVTANTI